MSSVFVIGPSLENVIEPEPAPTPAPGRVGIAFLDPATSPGGIVHVTLVPGEDGDTSVLPINVYAFYVNPPSSVPSPSERTWEWFFKSGAPSGSVATGHLLRSAAFDIVVPGVLPGAYHVQTVLEYAV